MNLADAIRKATAPSKTFGHAVTVQDRFASMDSDFATYEPPVEVPVAEAPAFELSVISGGKGELPQPEPQALVRIELFLTPGELARVMNSFAAAEPILGLEEASSVLGMSAARLDELASQNLIPSYKFDGVRRFSKMKIEQFAADKEWIGEFSS